VDTGRWRVTKPAIVAGTSLLCVNLLWWCRAGFVCFKSCARVKRMGRASLELPCCSAEFQPSKILTQKGTGTQKTPDILILVLILTLILCMGFPRKDSIFDMRQQCLFMCVTMNEGFILRECSRVGRAASATACPPLTQHSC